MNNKHKLLITALIALSLGLPAAVLAEGEGAALGQAVELTGGALPQELRDITGVGSGASSWDYLSQKISYGYFVEVYSNFDAIAKSKVDRRNGVEDLVVSSYKADFKANLAIADVKFNQDYAQHVMATEFAQRSGRGTQIANTYTMNTYLPHSDGSVEYFKDGLLARVDNQRSTDEFGFVSIKNLYNFVYDQDRRLMLSHEYDTTNINGLKTHGTFSCTYTADSVFYGGDEANANKHYMTYAVNEVDSNGKVNTATWTAGVYEGKFLRSFKQKNYDSVAGTTEFSRFNIQYSAPGQISSYIERGVGLHQEGETGSNVPFTYERIRTNITYYRGQVASYDETFLEGPPTMTDGTVDPDTSTWTRTTSHVTMEYMDAPQLFGADIDPAAPYLKKTTIVSHTIKLDGSTEDSTSVTEYKYDSNNNCIGGNLRVESSGRNAECIEYSFTDGDGNKQILTRVENGATATYTYIDADGNTQTVAEADVVTEVKPAADYRGYTDSIFEVVGGTPMVKEMTSHMEYMGVDTDDPTVDRVEDTTVTYTNGIVGCLPRVLATHESSKTSFTTDPTNEHQTIKNMTTNYKYDTNGNLIGASGEGFEDAWEYSSEKGWYSHSYSKQTAVYTVKLDKAVLNNIYVQSVSIPDAADLESMGITEAQFKAYMKGYFKLHPPEIVDGELVTILNPFINAAGEWEKPGNFDEVIALGESDEPLPPADDPFAAYPDETSLLAKAWDLFNAKDYTNAMDFANEIIRRYADTAAEQQASLKTFAPAGKESDYWALNDVAIAYFMKGKAYQSQNNISQAKKQFQAIISKYSFAQCWDPQGWFWKVAVGAQEALDEIG